MRSTNNKMAIFQSKYRAKILRIMINHLEIMLSNLNRLCLQYNNQRNFKYTLIQVQIAQLNLILNYIHSPFLKII